MGVRYDDATTAKADANGNLAVTLPKPVLGRHVVTGSITVLGAPSGAVFTAWVGPGGVPGQGRAWGSWDGNAPSPSVQAEENLSFSVTGSGLNAGTTYSVQLVGGDQDVDADYIVYIAPSQSFPQSVSVGNLDFQHNGSLVANEQALDFVDGAVQWTLTDDGANKRMKIAAGVPSAGVSTQVLSGDIHPSGAGETVLFTLAVVQGVYAAQLMVDYQPGSATAEQWNLKIATATGGSFAIDHEASDGGPHSYGLPATVTPTGADTITAAIYNFAGGGLIRKLDFHYGLTATFLQVTRLG